MILSDKHLFLTASTEMQELIRPLAVHNITYFTYNKNYIDGTRIRLTTNAAHLKAFLENEYYRTGNIDAHPELYHNQAALCSTLKNQSLVEWAKNEFQIENGIYIIRKSETYTEFFSFATPPNNPQIVNFYLNNLDYLQKFCDYFKEQGKDLIARAEKQKLIHVYHHDEGIQPVQFAELKASLKLQHYKLSPRQYQVVELLLQGFRAKEIAKMLHLSPRTVEDYIAALKHRFQAKNLIELMVKISNQASIHELK